MSYLYVLNNFRNAAAKECNIPFYDLYKSNFRLFDSGRLFITKALMETYKRDGIESMWGDELVKSFKFVTLLFNKQKEQDKIDIIKLINSIGFIFFTKRGEGIAERKEIY